MTTREKYESILKYLPKNYEIKNDRFWDIHYEKEVKGNDITSSLIIIFQHGKEYCDYCLKRWALNNGLPEKEWGKAYHNIDAEAELTALLSDQISQEIDREILNNLFGLRYEE